MVWQAPSGAPAITTATSTIEAGLESRCRAEGTVTLPTTGAASQFTYRLQGSSGGASGSDFRNQAESMIQLVHPQVRLSPLAVGYLYTCHVNEAWGAQCWGNNNQRVIGSTLAANPQLTPIDVMGLTSGIVSIDTGTYHVCALTTAGGVKCWGDNGYGQLGDGTKIGRANPMDVMGLTSGVRTIAVGSTHSCAITQKWGVTCWGHNTNGQLGNGAVATQAEPSPLRPVEVVGLTSGVQAIAAGTRHTCAVTPEGGVRCWGGNAFGQLGDGTTTDRPTPGDVVPIPAPVTALAAGMGNSCALTVDGEVYCWGYNCCGELGIGIVETGSLLPVKVLLSTPVQAISANMYASCAITRGGEVICWGDNRGWQMGEGASGEFQPTPAIVHGLPAGGYTDVSTSWHTCAQHRSGEVYCWGSNGSGQLGDGTTTDRRNPAPVLFP
jgi:alpha-tubulin suppressor-like RCC1 family protein